MMALLKSKYLENIEENRDKARFLLLYNSRLPSVVDYRLRHGGFAAAGVGRRRERGPGAARTSPREEGVGGEFRQAENDAAVPTAESDRALALFAIRVSQHPAVLLPAHRSVQEGTRRPASQAAANNTIIRYRTRAGANARRIAREIYRASSLSLSLSVLRNFSRELPPSPSFPSL